MAGRTLAIGDIHGCATALRTLLEAIAPQPEDTIVTLGDYVDRGPNSKDAISQLLELSKKCQLIPIIGNHEEMMLSVVADKQPPHYWLEYGGIDTLDSYGFSGTLDVIPRDHVKFLLSCRNYYETDTHFFLHANYKPDMPLDTQPIKTMRWRSLKESVPPPHKNGKVAIVGHTPDKSGEVFYLKHLICIDTYCYGGEWLTALDVDNKTVWQANDEGKLRGG